MSRSFAERIKDPVWWLEQAAHGWIGIGAALVSLAISAPTGGSTRLMGIGCIVFAALAGSIRELVQNIGDSDNNVPDSIADALFTTFGGVVLSIPFWIVA